MKRYWSLLITSDLSPSILPVDSIQPYHDWWIVICVTGNLIRLEDISHVVDAELIQKTLKVYFFQEKWQPCFFRMAFQSISHIRVAYGNWENVVCLCVFVCVSGLLAPPNPRVQRAHYILLNGFTHTLRFTLSEFSAPCPSTARKNKAGRTESPKFATPKWPDLAWLLGLLVGAWAVNHHVYHL